MNTRIHRFARFTFVFLLAVSALRATGAEGPYRLLKEIPVAGGGSWDYLAVDEAARRLYVSHGTKVVVIDLDQDKVVGEIADTPGIHGVALAPELGRAFTSNGQEAKASIVDLKTLQTLSKVPTGENPDAILYEPGQKEVYAFNGRGKSVTIFGAENGKVITTVRLAGKPEFAVADTKAGLVYCNLEDKNEVVVLDAKTHRLTQHWLVTPGEEPSGMAFDAAHHRLFVGCGNQLMAMMDSTSGKILATVPIGDGVDANAFDPATQLAFASCRDGTVTIAHEDSPEKLTVVQTLKTQRGARTMALDPKTHRIYLPAVQYEPQAAGSKERPKAITGTFKILVYGMDKQ